MAESSPFLSSDESVSVGISDTEIWPAHKVSMYSTGDNCDLIVHVDKVTAQRWQAAWREFTRTQREIYNAITVEHKDYDV